MYTTNSPIKSKKKKASVSESLCSERELNLPAVGRPVSAAADMNPELYSTECYELRIVCLIHSLPFPDLRSFSRASASVLVVKNST